MVEQLPRLYERHNYLAEVVVYQATPEKEFSILVASFSPNPVYLMERQAMPKAAEHSVALMETTITHGEMVGAVETKTVYKKRNKSTKEIWVIKKFLSRDREAAVRKVDETIDADDVKLGADEKYHPQSARCSANRTNIGQLDLGT